MNLTRTMGAIYTIVLENSSFRYLGDPMMSIFQDCLYEVLGGTDKPKWEEFLTRVWLRFKSSEYKERRRKILFAQCKIMARIRIAKEMRKPNYFLKAFKDCDSGKYIPVPIKILE